MKHTNKYSKTHLWGLLALLFLALINTNNGYATTSLDGDLAGNTIVDYVLPVNLSTQRIAIDKHELKLNLNVYNNPAKIFYLGDYGTSWNVDLDVDVTLYNGTNPIKTYNVALSITDENPESIALIDFSQIANATHFTFSVNNYTTPPALIAPYIQLQITDQKEERRDVVDTDISGNMLEISTLNLVPFDVAVVSEQTSLLTFNWALQDIHASFNRYDLEVVKIEPDINGKVILDWDKATSIEIENGATSFSMVLADGTGYYVARVRPIGNYYPGGRSNKKNYGQWSNALSTGTDLNTNFGLYTATNTEKPITNKVNEFNPINESSPFTLTPVSVNLTTTPVFYYNQFDEQVNWIYGRVYTEGSRQSETMTIANGLNQVHQQQTKLFGEGQGTDIKGEVIGTQTVYDYSARGALQSLPAPMDKNQLFYKNDFFLSADGDLVTAADFDADAAIFPTTSFLSTTSGTIDNPNKYYSEENNGSRYIKGEYVPDAKGFPFSRTLFYSDATGRVLKQSGAGDEMRLKADNDNTRNVQTLYGDATADELDRLFGNEAPFNNTVRKQMTIDPNGLLSFSYIAQDGSVIGTGLSEDGTTPALLDVGNETNGFTVTDVFNEGKIVTGKNESTVFKQVIVIGNEDVDANATTPKKKRITINYEITPNKLALECGDICAWCDYKVAVSITNPQDPTNAEKNVLLTFDIRPEDLGNCDTSSATPITLAAIQSGYNHQLTTVNTAGEWDAGVSVIADLNILSQEVKLLTGTYIFSKTVFTNNNNPNTNLTYLQEYIQALNDERATWELGLGNNCCDIPLDAIDDGINCEELDCTGKDSEGKFLDARMETLIADIIRFVNLESAATTTIANSSGVQTPYKDELSLPAGITLGQYTLKDASKTYTLSNEQEVRELIDDMLTASFDCNDVLSCFSGLGGFLNNNIEKANYTNNPPLNDRQSEAFDDELSYVHAAISCLGFDPEIDPCDQFTDVYLYDGTAPTTGQIAIWHRGMQNLNTIPFDGNGRPIDGADYRYLEILDPTNTYDYSAYTLEFQQLLSTVSSAYILYKYPSPLMPQSIVDLGEAAGRQWSAYEICSIANVPTEVPADFPIQPSDVNITNICEERCENNRQAFQQAIANYLKEYNIAQTIGVAGISSLGIQSPETYIYVYEDAQLGEIEISKWVENPDQFIANGGNLANLPVWQDVTAVFGQSEECMLTAMIASCKSKCSLPTLNAIDQTVLLSDATTLAAGGNPPNYTSLNAPFTTYNSYTDYVQSEEHQNLILADQKAYKDAFLGIPLIAPYEDPVAYDNFGSKKIVQAEIIDFIESSIDRTFIYKRKTGDLINASSAPAAVILGSGSITNTNTHYTQNISESYFITAADGDNTAKEIKIVTNIIWEDDENSNVDEGALKEINVAFYCAPNGVLSSTADVKWAYQPNTCNFYSRFNEFSLYTLDDLFSFYFSKDDAFHAILKNEDCGTAITTESACTSNISEGLIVDFNQFDNTSNPVLFKLEMQTLNNGIFPIHDIVLWDTGDPVSDAVSGVAAAINATGATISNPNFIAEANTSTGILTIYPDYTYTGDIADLTLLTRNGEEVTTTVAGKCANSLFDELSCSSVTEQITRSCPLGYQRAENSGLPTAVDFTQTNNGLFQFWQTTIVNGINNTNYTTTTPEFIFDEFADLNQYHYYQRVQKFSYNGINYTAEASIIRDIDQNYGKIVGRTFHLMLCDDAAKSFKLKKCTQGADLNEDIIVSSITELTVSNLPDFLYQDVDRGGATIANITSSTNHQLSFNFNATTGFDISYFDQITNTIGTNTNYSISHNIQFVGSPRTGAINYEIVEETANIINGGADINTFALCLGNSEQNVLCPVEIAAAGNAGTECLSVFEEEFPVGTTLSTGSGQVFATGTTNAADFPTGFNQGSITLKSRLVFNAIPTQTGNCVTEACDVCLRFEQPKKILENNPNIFIVTPDPLTCEEEKALFVAGQTDILLDQCLNTQVEDLKALYRNTCLENINDEMVIGYELSEHHYTLYYYDRAGNLTKTVPPAGVVPITDNTQLQAIKDHRKDPVANPTAVFPAHATIVDFDDVPETNGNYTDGDNLTTRYEFNSIKQLIEQETPDGGVTKFWYNAASQLILSQDAQQALENTYAYTRYDALGRIVEVGELVGFTPAFLDNDKDVLGDNLGPKQRITNLWFNRNFPYQANNPTQLLSGITNVQEAVFTTYTTPESGVSCLGETQQNLRNRIAKTETQDGFKCYYSYDPHGNVEWLITEMPEIGRKSIRYEYDLISGNVNKVFYNENEPDQFIHSYTYDADNRITTLHTSTDGIQWDREAKYDYYVHGPLLRTEIGNDNIQGTDYVYTIEGFLKSINQSELLTSKDPSRDGDTTLTFVPDEFGMELGYYQGDYTRGSSGLIPTYIGVNNTGIDPFANIAVDGQTHSLFNGNISYWMSSTRAGQNNRDIRMNRYKYDKLNRLRGADYMTFDRATAAWNNTTAYDAIGADADPYDVRLTYDFNGNIKQLKRNGKPGMIAMDNMTYDYTLASGITNPLTNRLNFVNDAVTTLAGSPSDYTTDIDAGQASDNYTYDAEGNLVGDKAEGIVAITWNLMNKVESVKKLSDKADPSSDYFYLWFEYDAMGNRSMKLETERITQTANTPVQDLNVIKGTYYYRDASGNCMAIYQKDYDQSTNLAEVKLIEQGIYGSERIGQYQPQNQVLATVQGGNDNNGNFDKIGQLKAMIEANFEPTITSENITYLQAANNAGLQWVVPSDLGLKVVDFSLSNATTNTEITTSLAANGHTAMALKNREVVLSAVVNTAGNWQVYDKNYSLITTLSAAETGVNATPVFVAKPNTNNYYFFYINPATRELTYAEIDAVTNSLITTGVAYSGNNIGNKLLNIEYEDGNSRVYFNQINANGDYLFIKAIEITAAGISSAPCLLGQVLTSQSNTLSLTNDMAISPKGNIMAVTLYQGATPANQAVGFYDAATLAITDKNSGLLTNPTTYQLASIGSGYVQHIEFSPAEKYLYTSINNAGNSEIKRKQLNSTEPLTSIGSISTTGVNLQRSAQCEILLNNGAEFRRITDPDAEVAPTDVVSTLLDGGILLPNTFPQPIHYQNNAMVINTAEGAQSELNTWIISSDPIIRTLEVNNSTITPVVVPGVIASNGIPNHNVAVAENELGEQVFNYHAIKPFTAVVVGTPGSTPVQDFSIFKDKDGQFLKNGFRADIKTSATTKSITIKRPGNNNYYDLITGKDGELYVHLIDMTPVGAYQGQVSTDANQINQALGIEYDPVRNQYALAQWVDYKAQIAKLYVAINKRTGSSFFSGSRIELYEFDITPTQGVDIASKKLVTGYSDQTVRVISSTLSSLTFNKDAWLGEMHISPNGDELGVNIAIGKDVGSEMENKIVRFNLDTENGSILGEKEQEILSEVARPGFYFNERSYRSKMDRFIMSWDYEQTGNRLYYMEKRAKPTPNCTTIGNITICVTTTVSTGRPAQPADLFLSDDLTTATNHDPVKTLIQAYPNEYALESEIRRGIDGRLYINRRPYIASFISFPWISNFSGSFIATLPYKNLDYYDPLVPTYSSLSLGVSSTTYGLPLQPYKKKGISTTSPLYASREIGDRRYELKDHLGNVRVVLSDVRETSLPINTNISTFTSDMSTADIGTFWNTGAAGNGFVFSAADYAAITDNTENYPEGTSGQSFKISNAMPNGGFGANITPIAVERGDKIKITCRVKHYDPNKFAGYIKGCLIDYSVPGVPLLSDGNNDLEYHDEFAYGPGQWLPMQVEFTVPDDVYLNGNLFTNQIHLWSFPWNYDANLFGDSYYDDYKIEINGVEVTASVVSWSDYYAFGSLLPGRSGNSNAYRYGYQGSEKDDEITGSGNSYTTFYRQNDPRLGKWLSYDPKPTAWESPYVSMGNNPITNNDVLGDRINVRKLKKKDPEAYKKLKADLEEQTGYKLVYKSGNLVLNDKREKPKTGSSEARKQLNAAINSPLTVKIKPGSKGSYFDGKSSIYIDKESIGTLMNNTVGVDPKTVGFGLTLFHELDHWRTGNIDPNQGDLRDTYGDKATLEKGNTVEAVNRIRMDLNANGGNYGIRESYYIIYGNTKVVPFSKTTKDDIINKGVLDGQFTFIRMDSKSDREGQKNFMKRPIMDIRMLKKLNQ